MVPGQDFNTNAEGQDPFLILGLNQGASFDEIQKAKQEKIKEANDDPLKKAKVEAAYDSLLMISLKDRQLGNVSNDAATASQREEFKKAEVGGVGSSLLTRLKSFTGDGSEQSSNKLLPSLNLPVGQGLTIRISIGILLFVLLLISPAESIEIILSLSTIGLFISQVRRGRKLLPSLGWSVVLLSIGLIIGGLISGGAVVENQSLHSLTPEKLEALPAFVLIFLGSILLD